MRPPIPFLAPAFAMLAIIGAARPAAANQVLTVTGVQTSRYDYATGTYDTSQVGTAFTATFAYDDTTPAYVQGQDVARYLLPTMSVSVSYSGGVFEESAPATSQGSYVNAGALFTNDPQYTEDGTIYSFIDSFILFDNQSMNYGLYSRNLGASLSLSKNVPPDPGGATADASMTMNLAGFVTGPSGYGLKKLSIHDYTDGRGDDDPYVGSAYDFDVISITGSAVAAPEPGAMVLAASGLPVALAFWLRRRREAASKATAA